MQTHVPLPKNTQTNHNQPGDLTAVEGGFTTPLGTFQASWTLFPTNNSYTLSYTVPLTSTGTVLLPANLPNSTTSTTGNTTTISQILLDGVPVNLGDLVVDEGTETVMVSAVGGSHSFLVEF